MFTKKMKYKDFNGVERVEEFQFNLTDAEITDMEMTTKGGFTQLIQRVVSAQDTPEIIRIFKEIILASYGVKSADGKHFRKSPEITADFTDTNAYSQLYMELALDDKAAAAFINGIMPAELSNKAKVKMPENINSMAELSEYMSEATESTGASE